MKTTTLIRIFALFPLLGILIPDLSIALCDLKLKAPLSHIITCICMLIIIVSTFLMQRYQSAFLSVINRQRGQAGA